MVNIRLIAVCDFDNIYNNLAGAKKYQFSNNTKSIAIAYGMYILVFNLLLFLVCIF